MTIPVEAPGPASPGRNGNGVRTIILRNDIAFMAYGAPASTALNCRR